VEGEQRRLCGLNDWGEVPATRLPNDANPRRESGKVAALCDGVNVMNLPAIKKFCSSMPHATADVKWAIDHVYSIGGKMFAIACKTNSGATHLSFKVDDDRFLEYTDRPGFIPAPYMARAKWVQVADLTKVTDAELRALIKRSYQLVAAKLSKKQQREFGLP